MLGAAPLPIYSVARRKSTKKAAAAPSNTSPNPPPPVPTAPTRHHPNSITALLEPAIDGPPSPESIRALSKQMKRSSFRDKHHSQQTTSSGSSSLRSFASADRTPSWDQALEGISLSRKSSGRSVASNMQHRERPESVQIFGKTLFNRRGKVKRDSGAPSSSGSSLYSTDMPADATAPPPPPTPTMSVPGRDTLIPTFFNRRRTLKPDAEVEQSEARRKFQISGPYNFQHLTHTQREQVPNLQRGSRMALQSEFSALRAAQASMDGNLRGIQAESLHFADFSSEALPLTEEMSASINETHTRLSLSRTGGIRQHTSPPRLRHSRSQEVLSLPPPRPPRSPVEPVSPAPPIPPPRISSRISMKYDGFDPLASTSLDRPRTSGGFRQPAPLALSTGGLTKGLSNVDGFSSTADDMMCEKRYSRIITPIIDDANWPLTCPSTTTTFDKALPDVPEEEEHPVMVRRSRMSIASNNSSLRGSQSVPLLRQMAQSQGSATRPMSGGSDTLGRFDLFSAQRTMRGGMDDGDDGDMLRDNWEDDIDYCYEHAVEADCEYAWDRPSLDLTREEEGTPIDERLTRVQSDLGISPGMLTPARFDVPALSPASQISAASTHEAVTPTAATVPSSNFSMPRAEARRSKARFLHIRTDSHASSFKESHGFTLSPSLLIPGSDYERHMMDHEADQPPSHEDFPVYDEPTLTMDTSTLLVQPRTSASTTGSNGTDNSGSERHISTASTATDLTRLTMSTASLDIDDVTPPGKQGVEAENQEPEPSHARGQSEPMAVLMEEPPESPTVYRNFSRSSSDPRLARLLKDDRESKLAKQKDSLLRRPRAKTTNSAPSPRQYGLFPTINRL